MTIKLNEAFYALILCDLQNFSSNILRWRGWFCPAFLAVNSRLPSYVTSLLELVGTYTGAWAWAYHEPTLGLSQANPPSGIATWYCLIDAVAIAGAPRLAWCINRCLQWGNDSAYPEIRHFRVTKTPGAFLNSRRLARRVERMDAWSNK